MRLDIFGKFKGMEIPVEYEVKNSMDEYGIWNDTIDTIDTMDIIKYINDVKREKKQ